MYTLFVVVMVAFLLILEAVVTFLKVYEKNDFVVANELDVGLSEFCVELKVITRRLYASVLPRTIELVKASSILDNALGWLETSAVLQSALDGIRIEGAELTVDVASGGLSTVS